MRQNEKIPDLAHKDRDFLKFEIVVGDPGIEPGMGLPGGVTVRCRTLQHVARREGWIITGAGAVNREIA